MKLSGMRLAGFLCSFVVVLVLVSMALASWKGTGLRLGITKTGNTTSVQGVQMNASSITALDGTFTGKVEYATDTLSATGPTDDVDVSGINVLKVDTASNNVTIGGLANGTDGQVLHVVVVDPTNNAILEHNEAGGSQDIFLSDGADETITASYGGWTLVCNGTSWFEVDQ